MTTYDFEDFLAKDPAGNIVPHAEVTLYATGDTARATPLQTWDLTDSPVTLTATDQGYVPPFRTTEKQVVAVSGSFAITLSSYAAVTQIASDAATAASDAATSAASSASDAKAAADQAGIARAGAVSKWQPDTQYAAGQPAINPSGDLVTAIADHTSGTTYTAANWVKVGHVRDQSSIVAGASNLSNRGLILAVGSAGTFDAGKVESPCVFFDQTAGHLAMLYTGYTTTDTTAVASHGLAYSDDGFTWTKSGQFFTASGTAGAPDEKGVTGPVLIEENGTYHLFYIGLTAVGYEGGNKTICHATASSLSGPWTRHGAVVSPSYTTTGVGAWRDQYVWHPNLVKNNNKWYLFFNATNAAGLERAGYATAATLDGPWTVDDANSPILPDTGHTTDSIWGGDPFVFREDDHWRMEFANADPSWGPVGDWYATTTDNLFPLGWVIGGQSTHNDPGGMKPWITRRNGEYLHYASSSAGITVSAAQKDRQFTHKSTDNFDSSLIVGENINPATGAGRAKVTIGSTTDISELILGQDSQHGVLFAWKYNATASSATASLETYAGANPLTIQDNGGAVTLGGSSGQVGFYGAAPVAKPALTYSRATETAADTQLRTALVALGLVTDSTTA